MSTSDNQAITFEQIQIDYNVTDEELRNLISTRKLNAKDILGKTYVTQNSKFIKSLESYKKHTKPPETIDIKGGFNEEGLIEELMDSSKELSSYELMKLIKLGCREAKTSTKWAKIAMEMIHLERKMEQSNKMPPERYYEIIKELVNAPDVTPMPVGGYSG